uniref:preprotein translocase subunit SecA n=1 Tax=Fibrocapsa japonica TaxID=94617 RepID=UPI0021150524|nr:preprotein translocase subunit SecA [Fibrocapsa japonica]YP_010444392.1 preprotein translocase subunit SecA [Fibrocapsa japonica]UTE95109.1 preprotein translocase subunit SecA [Fibrocapsa japonica]UTE95278.1 preprotein translocase subunit SecA [Fibrocapsa japonica]
MLNFLSNEQIVKKQYEKILNSINFLEDKFKGLTDEELKSNTVKLKKKYLFEKKYSDEIITEAFSLVRETSTRTIGLRHYDAQILGGLVLNEGKIAEMKTGEGKTLVSTLPAFVNALSGKGVHLVTVNDYLAKRDTELTSQIYNFLGMDVGLIQPLMTEDQKKKNYDADITYVTNSDLGFDFLRDNMIFSLKDSVLRGFNYCIIDEVDSVLIDESRTPLILANSYPIKPRPYILASEVAKYLNFCEDYETDERTKNVMFTGKGINKIEKMLFLKNIFEADEPWIFHVANALKAKLFFLQDSDYIIIKDKIAMIDDFTGRAMPDRRWSDGLHESIEAKENLTIQSGSKQLASITYQNFFIGYEKFAGMTGTAKTAEVEFEKIYGLEVTVIPTIKPNRRNDLPDFVYINEVSKWKAVAKECKNMYECGRPVLVGTGTIEKSEFLSGLLKDGNIPHQLLNAKPENLIRESEIVALAGKHSTITISTNMAGRGTDIILGGKSVYNSKNIIKNLIVVNLYKNSFIQKSFGNKELKSKITPYILNKMNSLILKSLKFENMVAKLNTTGKSKTTFEKVAKCIYHFINTNYKESIRNSRTLVGELGGLYVIGTGRNNSKRIDNQLRGRAGRQGDPGSSRFFVSLEDKPFSTFGGDQIQNLAKNFQLDFGETPIESKFLAKALDNAQEKVESYNYDIRKQVSDYDKILNEQRTVFFKLRNYILRCQFVRHWYVSFGDVYMEELIDIIFSPDFRKSVLLQKLVFGELEGLFGFDINIEPDIFINTLPEILYEFLVEQFWLIYLETEEELEMFEDNLPKDFEKCCLLKGMDFAWKNHLEKMEELKETIGWRAYAQRDPLNEYKKEAYLLFFSIFEDARNQALYEFLNFQHYPV